MGIFDSLKNKLRTPEVTTDQQDQTMKTEVFRVAGARYYENNIKKLACANPEWKMKNSQLIDAGKAGQKIFRYNYINKPAKLVPEPKNPHDKNAVAVVIAGKMVGYIGKDDNKHVLDILKHQEIKYISSFIGGGKYKIVSLNGDAVTWDTSLEVSVKIAYV